MNAQLAKAALQVSALVPALLLTAGCASYWVRYDKQQTSFREGGPKFDKTGRELEAGTIRCSGALVVTREHGLFWWPGGFYRDEDDYGVYFKESGESSHDFYFTMSRYYEQPRIAEAQGEVFVADHSASIDIEYRDAKGKWRKSPINGIHKIDCVLPEDAVPRANASAEAAHR